MANYVILGYPGVQYIILRHFYKLEKYLGISKQLGLGFAYVYSLAKHQPNNGNTSKDNCFPASTQPQ